MLTLLTFFVLYIFIIFAIKVLNLKTNYFVISKVMLIEIRYRNKRRRYNQRESCYLNKEFIKNHRIHHFNIS